MAKKASKRTTQQASPSFVTSFMKDLEKMDDVGTSAQPPRYWYSTGCFVLNKIISGSFFKGIPQGRITDLAGSSGAGKSFLAANLVKAAQAAGATVLVIDSENALDNDFMGKIGVDVNNGKYLYAEVTTIAHVINVVSKFIQGYKDAVGDDHNGEQVLILIDSLDMLMTTTEEENLEKGIQKGDQGQRNRQLKAMLRGFVQSIKTLNIAMVCTSQVYKNQDVLNGEGVWIVSDAVKYACSQIILLSKLKLREKEKGSTKQVVTGINMKAEGYKTRFTKPFQTVNVEVPYEAGMDPYSGLADALVSMGILSVNGGKYRIIDGDPDLWFYESGIAAHAENLLVKAEAQAQAFLSTKVGTAESDVEPDLSEHQGESAKARRAAKAAP